jgi:hypothetical protein
MVEPAGGDWNPTFYPYGANAAVPPTSTGIAVGTSMMSLTLTAKQRLGLLTNTTNTNNEYVVFGLGNHTSMQGKSLQEAPVHFADTQDENPNRAYGRYGLVFQLSSGTVTTGTSPLQSARLAQIVAFHDDGVVNLGSHLSEYYNATAN